MPFVYDGEVRIPAIQEFIDKATKAGYNVTLAIVVRDRNINALQQERVRDGITLPIAMSYYNSLDHYERVYLDHEALFLHKVSYIRFLGRLLGIPVVYDNLSHLDVDSNNKYVRYVEEHWLDQEVWNGLRPKDERK